MGKNDHFSIIDDKCEHKVKEHTDVESLHQLNLLGYSSHILSRGTVSLILVAKITDHKIFFCRFEITLDKEMYSELSVKYFNCSMIFHLK
jgi:hypothetical protein